MHCWLVERMFPLNMFKMEFQPYFMECSPYIHPGTLKWTQLKYYLSI